MTCDRTDLRKLIKSVCELYTGEKLLCAICSKKFSNNKKSIWYNFLRTYIRKKSHLCEKCSKPFSYRYVIKILINSPCLYDVCLKTFARHNASHI